MSYTARPSSVSRLAGALGLLASLAACDPGETSDSTEQTGGGGKADEVTDPAEFACQSVGGIALEAMVEKHDPIAELLIKQGEGCPTSYGQMLDKLAQTDAQDCANDVAGLRTRVVSDNARFGVASPNYRTVTTKQCGDRAPGEFVWTFLSVRADEDVRNRSFIEMAAFDPVAGMFNYYTLSSGGFRFEADSAALMAGTASCSSCHPAGGLIMKELDEPWIHWELDGHELPGADELFAQHGDAFGERGNGEDLELAAREVNGRLNVTRVRHFADPEVGSVELLLKPLFCPVEINLDTAGEAPGAPVQEIPPDFFVDPFFIEGLGGVPVDPAVYDGAIADARQFVPSTDNEPDTAIKLVFPERSGIDVDYVQKLLDEGVVDEDFVADVLSIDFTNPLFSDARCDLLEFAPSFPAAAAAAPDEDPGLITEATPETVRQGFIASLQEAAPEPGSAGEQLLTALQDPDDTAAHRDRVSGYLAACRERPGAEIMADALQVVSAVRDRVRNMSIIEHPQQLPDIEAASDASFEQTCTLQ